MIGAIGGGGRMPSAEMVSRMREKMFTKADADGSGGLDKTEFASMVKESPRGKSGANVDDATQLFERMDVDGNNALSKAEMQEGSMAMRKGFQSTLDRFGGGNGSSVVSSGGADSMQALLDMIQSRQADASSSTGDAASEVSQRLERMIANLSSSYSESRRVDIASMFFETA